jgi:hypothetical protein
MPVTPIATPAIASSAPVRSRHGAAARRWTRMRTAVRDWLERGHLGPVDNYITR